MRRRTPYFEFEVLLRRPYVTVALCDWVIEHPVESVTQPDGRVRYWGAPPELDGKFLRVVLLEDNDTLHNAFIDRSFRG